MKKRISKVVSLVLVVIMLVIMACGCKAKNSSTESDNSSTSDDESKQAEQEEGVRYAPEWTKNAVIYEVNIRQYTEDSSFKAFTERLQELKDTGVNTLWIMPMFPISETKRSGVLGSYYSITDYRKVNPEFGTEEDFAAMVDKAHELGMHVMVDWVANHTGWDCAWIKDHPDWYTQDSNGNIISPLNQGWPDVADLNFDNEDMRAEMISCMEYWVKEYDIDGYRCDHASGVPKDFWEDAREALDAIKPIYMLAEDGSNTSYLEKAFDMNYNWYLYDTILRVAKGAKTASNLSMYIPKNYPDGTYTLNFLDNHDKNSYENTIIEACGKDALPAFFAYIYTIPGVPLLYTGDEVGLNHRLAFMEKDTVNWDTGVSYRDLLKTLSDTRSNNAALYSGNYGGAINYYENTNKDTITFYREKDGNTVKCIFNLSKKEQKIDVSKMVDGTETVVVHGTAAEYKLDSHAVSEDNLSGEVTLKPWEFYILTK